MAAVQGPFILIATYVDTTRVLTASIKAKGPSEAEKLAASLQVLAKRANSDAEPETKTYRVVRSQDGLTFVVFEEYESEAGLDAHKNNPEFQKMFAESADLTTDFNMEFYKEI
ncbi:hypothetical protein MSPP1_003725 [Malassezia sp. CBS 17886]|nr:hypothetical protein MSPP1_003725 [Malassezia sp. CBS 17886]